MTTSPGTRFPFLASCFPPARARSEPGFTILELSVVLVIISLVTAMAVTSGVAVIATARQSATVRKMAAIDKALMAFRVANDRIPCPSDLTIPPGNVNYGVEAGSPSLSTNLAGGLPEGVWSACINGPAGTPQANLYSLNVVPPSSPFTSSVVVAAEGGVPTVALGLPNDFMYDGWGNHIRYAVDVNMTAAGSFSAMPAGALCGPITVCDSGSPNSTSGYTGAFPTGNCTNTPRSSAAMYVLMSHGANRFGAYTQSGVMTNSQSDNPNELINCHSSVAGAPSGPSFSPGPASGCISLVSGTPQTFPPVYVQQAPSAYISDVLDNFDDIVTYKERWQMQTAWDRQGTACPAIWGADPGDSTVAKFDMNGNFLLGIDPIGSPNGSADNQVEAPYGTAVDTNGNVWVMDYGAYRVQEFSSSGQWLMTIGGGGGTIGAGGDGAAGDDPGNCSGVATSSATAAPLPGTNGYCGQDQGGCTCNPGTVNGMFGDSGNYGPFALAIDTNNNIWVADTANNRVQKFSNSGQWLLTIGPTYTDGTLRSPPAANPGTCTLTACPSGTGNGEFNFPVGIAADPSGNVWVSDMGNNRVQKFNNNGQWLLTVGGDGDIVTSQHLCTGCVSTSACTCTSGATPGQFNNPAVVATDAGGNLWVSDTENSRVEEFSSSGTFLTPVSGFVGGGGANAMALDASGNLWVTSDGGGTLQEFSNIGGTWNPTGSPITICCPSVGVAVAR